MMTPKDNPPLSKTTDMGAKMRAAKKREPQFHDTYKFNGRTFKERNE